MGRKKKAPKKKAPKRKTPKVKAEKRKKKTPKVKAAPVNIESSSTDQAGSEKMCEKMPEATLGQQSCIEDRVATALELAVAAGRAHREVRDFGVTAEVFDAIVRQTAADVIHILGLEAPRRYGTPLKNERCQRIDP